MLRRHALDRVPASETQHRGPEGKRSSGSGDTPAGSSICLPEGGAAMIYLELDYFVIIVKSRFILCPNL